MTDDLTPDFVALIHRHAHHCLVRAVGDMVVTVELDPHRLGLPTRFVNVPAAVALRVGDDAWLRLYGGDPARPWVDRA